MEDQEPHLEELLSNDEDSLWYGPLDTAITSPPLKLMVYFIPGNPCLMSYYKLFLSHLSLLLNSSPEENRQPTIVGGSTLPGFQLSNPSTTKGTLPAGLDDEIQSAEELLAYAVARSGLRKGDGNAGKGPKVILMAHSVGAYMVLEILRRKAQRQRAGRFRYYWSRVAVPNRDRDCEILAGFHYESWIICFLGGMPRHIGEATAEFLKSPMGVYQALHLTIDEMEMIKLDSWDETVWGSSMAVTQEAVPLRFFFGEHDVWVSNKARDKLIASRASHEPGIHDTEKPVMVIDNEGIPHGFIINHSQRVAEKAHSMIRDLSALRKNRSA